MKICDLRVALLSGNYNYTRDGANVALNRLVGFLLSHGAAVRIYSPVVENTGVSGDRRSHRRPRAPPFLADPITGLPTAWVVKSSVTCMILHRTSCISLHRKRWATGGLPTLDGITFRS